MDEWPQRSSSSPPPAEPTAATPPRKSATPSDSAAQWRSSWRAVLEWIGKPAAVMLLAIGFLLLNREMAGPASDEEQMVLTALMGLLLTLIAGIKPR